MKRRLVAVFLVLVVPGLLAFASARQGQSDIELIVNAGYGGYYRKGQWTAVRVTVSNQGDNLDGEVRARTGDSGGLEEMTFSTPIDLPHGARKQIFLYVSLDSYTQRLQIEITDRNGHVVKRETANLRMANTNDILYAVITESPLGAVDLTGYAPTTGAAYQANWRIDDIPPLAEALDGLDIMMFHDVDTGTLRAEQVEAISNWVLSGGHLIVAGGDAWQRTTAGFQELLPVALEGTVPVNSMTGLADYLDLAAEPLQDGMTVTRTTPNRSTRVLVRVAGVPLVVRGSHGAGVVDFFAADPNAEPLRSWTGKSQLWYTLATSVGQQPSWLGGFKNWPVGREATLTTFSTVLPTIIQLCGFLVLYILLIGPINYLILKRLNRREWAWFTIPGLILLFSVLAYTVGFNLRGNTATVNRLSVIQVWPDSEQAQVDTLIGIQSPRRGSYDIAVERGYTFRALPEVGVGLNVSAAIKEGTRYTVDSIPIDGGTVASFVSSGYQSAHNFDAAAAWHLDPGLAPRMEGYITNTSEIVLEDAVLLIKGQSRYLGTLDPGETHAFEIEIGPQDPGPLTLGYLATWYSRSSWSYSYNSPGWCFSFSGLSLTIPDVMRQERFSCSGGSVSERAQEIRRRYRLLSALVVDTESSGGRDAGAYVFAWSDGPLVGVELAGRSVNEEDTNLYIIELPVMVASSGEIVEVPPGLTTWTLAELEDPTTLLEVGPAQFQLREGTQAAFQFMPMPIVRLDEVHQLAVSFQTQGPLAIQLWNWDRQVWVKINFDPEVSTIRINNPARFIGPENAVNVRILPEDSTVYNRVDYIKVAYHGRLME
ncbi:MAG: hypothetical protein JXQ72_10760 [Anaerolineae bacterium]|nr:hypothetical protein [Anaerolineae bacterium]